MFSKTLNLIFFCAFDIVIQLLLALPMDSRKGLSMCDLIVDSSTNQRLLKCSIGKGQFLDYRDLRTWSAGERGAKYYVQIVCNGGTLNLPWPFKAENIVSLEVNDCLVHGFLSEMTKKHTVADELQSLKLSRVSIDISLSEMFELRNNLNKITQDTDCGQLTLERLILQDVHYDVKATPEERDGMMHMHTKPPVHDQIPHEPVHKTCVYPNLKYVDESGSRKSGQYYLKLLPEYSLFPKLEIYNMSRNELTHIPKFFRNLQSDIFPQMKLIDFSNNFLRSFEFDLPKEGKSNLQIVDLHGNDIAALSPQTTQRLESIGTIFVDLRQNPLSCSCRLRNLRQYFQNQYRRTNDVRRRKRVTEVTCMLRSMPYGKLDRVSLLDVTLDEKCSTPWAK